MFHRQSDDFVTQAIKDTIPYFLGAINEEALALENERAVLKRRLTIERRRLEENRHLMGGGFERAVKLIGEARQVGLIDSSTQVDYQNYQEVSSGYFELVSPNGEFRKWNGSINFFTK